MLDRELRDIDFAIDHVACSPHARSKSKSLRMVGAQSEVRRNIMTKYLAASELVPDAKQSLHYIVHEAALNAFSNFLLHSFN